MDIQPHLLPNDRLLFINYLENARGYFEYGSGESTIRASKCIGLKRIYSVESDPDWFHQLSDCVKDDPRVSLIFVDLECHPRTWGHPGPGLCPSRKALYSDQWSRLSPDARAQIDLVLIDGRFRVACCLKMYEHVTADCIILFDDFFNRPAYHVVLAYYTVINQTSDHHMVVLQKKPNIQSPPNDLIRHYENISL